MSVPEQGLPLPVHLRRAKTADIRPIRELVAGYSQQRILLSKELVTLYEDVQDFVVADDAGRIVGCGALHVMWEDLAEIRTLAVRADYLGRGIGRGLLADLLLRARELGVAKVFCLTFEVNFFTSMGFEVIEGTPVEAEVFAELLRSYDEGVAEFLELERVKPNTLGNTRMLLRLDA